jgi:chromate transport protein ChrA
MTKLSRTSPYALCTAIIMLGFVMLIQPFSITAFTWGLPIMIIGIVIHIVLDHLPQAKDTTDIASDG